jgi:hypothetical protein
MILSLLYLLSRKREKGIRVVLKKNKHTFFIIFALLIERFHRFILIFEEPFHGSILQLLTIFLFLLIGSSSFQVSIMLLLVFSIILSTF